MRSGAVTGSPRSVRRGPPVRDARDQRPVARLRADRRQRRRGGRDPRPPGRDAAGHRARRGARPLPASRGDPARLGHQLDLLAAARATCPSDSDAPRRDLLEPRPARRRRAGDSSRAARRVRRGAGSRTRRRSADRPRSWAMDVLDGLGALVDQSLLRVEAPDDEARYRMLERSASSRSSAWRRAARRRRSATGTRRRFLEIAEKRRPTSRPISSAIGSTGWRPTSTTCAPRSTTRRRASRPRRCASSPRCGGSGRFRGAPARGYRAGEGGRRHAGHGDVSRAPRSRRWRPSAASPGGWRITTTCRGPLRAGAGRCGAPTATPRASPERALQPVVPAAVRVG